MTNPTKKPSKGGYTSHLMELTGNLQPKNHGTNPPAKLTSTAPGRLLDYGPKMQEAEDKLAEALRLKAEAEEILRRGGGADGEIDIDKIVVVPGRRRALTPEQFDELKANLANNPLITPVTLARRADGQLELIAGHNRIQAYQDLGKTKIKYILLPEGAMDSELAAFYSNLMSPALSDYEKYLGFARRQQTTGFDQAELAKEAGISRSSLNRIFAMGQLTEEAQQIIATNPSCLGYNAALELIALQSPATDSVITEALSDLAKGEITQAQAVSKVRAAASTKAPKATPSESVVKIGKRRVCAITRRKGMIALRFNDEDEAAAIEQLIADWVRSQVRSE